MFGDLHEHLRLPSAEGEWSLDRVGVILEHAEPLAVVEMLLGVEEGVARRHDVVDGTMETPMDYIRVVLGEPVLLLERESARLAATHLITPHETPIGRTRRAVGGEVASCDDLRDGFARLRLEDLQSIEREQ